MSGYVVVVVFHSLLFLIYNVQNVIIFPYFPQACIPAIIVISVVVGVVLLVVLICIVALLVRHWKQKG